MPEVDVVALPVAEAAREQARERLLVGEARTASRVGLAERAAGDREPVDDRVLFDRQLVQAIAR